MSRRTLPEHLVEILGGKGFQVDGGADGVDYPLGQWRREDVVRWECWGYFTSGKFKTSHRCHVFSWSTMTKCVRYGFEIKPDGDAWSFYAITKEPNKRATP